MKSMNFKKKVVVLIAGTVALLFAFNVGTSRQEPALTSGVLVNRSLAAEDVAPSDLYAKCLVRFFGVAPSRDMGAYLAEKYPRSPNDGEGDEGLDFAKETAKLCRDAYSKREAELLEHGVFDVAWRMTGGKFIFAANAGMTGNFELSFDVDRNPTAIAETFGAGLDKLLCLLRDLDVDSSDFTPADWGRILKTPQKREEQDSPAPLVSILLITAAYILAIAIKAAFKREHVENNTTTSGETNNDGT